MSVVYQLWCVMQALHDILAKSGECGRNSSSFSCFSEDAEDTDYSLVVKDGERLVSCLPSITHFALVLPQIYPFLLHACLVETNMNCLQHYLLFLTQNYPHEKLSESVIGISRLIVDRFDIIKKILSPSSSKQYEVIGLQGSYSVQLPLALFELFHSAMEAAIHSQTMPQLSGSSEFVLVTFPALSQKAILHTTFIQAVFLLLSLNPPQGTAYMDYTYLLDLWLPTQPHNRPEVSAIESKEKISLPPADVLSSTLLSTNPRLLEASVCAAKPALLCQFLEQAGSPVSCVEKVVEFLEHSCDTDSSVTAELRHCVTDPASLAGCVEVQMSRGVKCGASLISFLQSLNNQAPSDMDTSTAGKEDKADYRIGNSSSLRQRKSSSMQVQSTEPGLKPHSRRSSFSVDQEAIAKTVSATCKDIATRANPFEKEPAILRLSGDLTGNIYTVRHLETLLHALAKRCVGGSLEKQCIGLLDSVRTAATNSSSVAFQCNPELFASNKTTPPSRRPSSNEKMESDVSCQPDVMGLLIDVLELLDPEIVSVTPETSMRFLFGHSGGGSASSMASSVQSSLFLCGQGYLLARLVNNTSWCTLLSTISRILDKNSVQEWWVG